MTSHAPRHFGFIDALRGVAIAGVILVHTGQFVADKPGPLHSALEAGAKGVQLFYLLSAFTLTHSWFSRAPRQTILSFYIRRTFRVAPMFLIGIVLYLALYGLARPRYSAPHGFSLLNVVENIILPLNAWWPGPQNALVPGGMTIGVEFSFYLLLPLIIKHISNGRRAWLAFACASVFALISAYAGSRLYARVATPDITSNFVFNWLPVQFPIFLLGFSSYWTSKSDKVNRFLCTLPSSIVILSTLLFIPICFVIPLMPLGALKLFIYGFTFWSTLTLAAVVRVPVLDSKSLQNLGMISFSGYVIHWAILETMLRCGFFKFEAGLSKLTALTLTYAIELALVYAIGILTYKWIERPFVRLGERLAKAVERTPHSREAANLSKPAGLRHN